MLFKMKSSERSQIARMACALLVAVTSIIPLGCAGSGSFQGKVGGEFFGVPFSVFADLAWEAATPLPVTAVAIGTITIDGRTVPVYYDPETGDMYFKDSDGDVHKVKIDKLPPMLRRVLDKLREDWEERQRDDYQPTRFNDEEAIREYLESVELDADRYRHPTIADGTELASTLAPAGGDIVKFSTSEVTVDFWVDYNRSSTRDWTEVSTAVIDVTAAAEDVLWEEGPLPDVSRFNVTEFYVSDNGDGTVTLHAHGSVNAVFAIMMMAGMRTIEGEMGGLGNVEVRLDHSLHIGFINVDNQPEKEVYIHAEYE